MKTLYDEILKEKYVKGEGAQWPNKSERQPLEVMSRAKTVRIPIVAQLDVKWGHPVSNPEA